MRNIKTHAGDAEILKLFSQHASSKIPTLLWVKFFPVKPSGPEEESEGLRAEWLSYFGRSKPEEFPI